MAAKTFEDFIAPIKDESDPFTMAIISTAQLAWITATKAAEERFTSTNSRVMPCLCKEDSIHYKSVVGGMVKEASLSVVINKDCPRHGHYMRS